MKRMHVSELIRGLLPPERFQEMYADELVEHLRLLGKKGSSAPIQLFGDEYIFIDKASFHRLLRFFIAGSLRKEMLSYLLDALTLDGKSRFASDEIREIAMDLADDAFSRQDVEEVLAG